MLGFGAPPTALGASAVPDRPDSLFYVSEGGHLNGEELESLTTLITDLNSAHAEKVGVLVTNTPIAGEDHAQQLADAALPAWRLDTQGAIIVITTVDANVGVAVSDDLRERVTDANREEVATQVSENIGVNYDWASGIRNGITKMFLLIEASGVGGSDGNNDPGHGQPGHTHAPDDPAVVIVPYGETPHDAYVGEQVSVGDVVRIVMGLVVAVAAGIGLYVMWGFFSRSREIDSEESDSDGPVGDDGKLP